VIRIAKVEALFLRYRYPSHLSYRFAAGVVENLEAGLIRVTADLEGYVEMRQATTVNIARAEILPTAPAFRPYLERGTFDIVQFDNFTEHPLNDLLAVEPVRVRNGHVAVPETPGLGVQLDPSLVQRFPYVPAPNTMMSTEERDLEL
jgi:hypothetical protein